MTDTMNFKVTTINGRNISDIKTAVTHMGIFHADDVCSTALLELLGADLEIIRVRAVTEEHQADDTIIFDIGGGRYDHHDGTKFYEDGCPYAAFGLIAKDIMVDGICLEEAFPGFTASIAKPIEARDNGKVFDGISPSYFAEIVNPYNPLWDGDEQADVLFREAVDMVKPILARQMEKLASVKRAKTIVDKAEIINNVAILEKFAPWQAHIGDSVLAVVYPSVRGGYNVQLAPSVGFETKAFFDWDKLDGDKKKEEVTTFVHQNGFLCACNTMDDAMDVIKTVTLK